MAFVKVCRRDALEDGEALKLSQFPMDVALFNVGGEFFATQDQCTHGQWSLSDGYVDGDVVECALHLGKFCVRTGAVRSAPASQSLRTFAVRVEQDDVLIDFDIPATGADSP